MSDRSEQTTGPSALFVHRSLLLAAFLGSTGCARSALIRDDDVAFARASARLERTAAEVEESGAPAQERAIFLQAEAMYRYRFTPSGRGTASFAAEAAAAVTDFPVLQSLAGSLDLADLRMKSADAAAQIWESFLLRYPRSPLRPLALYRLGWAYRNVGISGLPRRSGDEAFDELARSEAPPAIVAAVPAARRVPWKSKDAASSWSLVPGLGQFYVGEPVSGAVRLAVALAAAAAIVTPAVIGATRASELTWKHDWPLLAIGVGGLIVLSFDYTSSYEDAMRGVVEWNERAEAKFDDEHPDAP
jgi:hypothetical protein